MKTLSNRICKNVLHKRHEGNSKTSMDRRISTRREKMRYQQTRMAQPRDREKMPSRTLRTNNCLNMDVVLTEPSTDSAHDTHDPRPLITALDMVWTAQNPTHPNPKRTTRQDKQTRNTVPNGLREQCALRKPSSAHVQKQNKLSFFEKSGIQGTCLTQDVLQNSSDVH